MKQKRMLRGCALILILWTVLFTAGCSRDKTDQGQEIVLRIANMEEYIDEGGWDEEETIELSDGTEISSEKGLVADYEDWYEKTYGKKVRVEYATVGTNEEIYNLMTLGNTFDVICPSEYMIMKLMNENRLVPFSEQFKDQSLEENYYVKGVSPYIEQVFEGLSINGEPVSRYAAGYMWGTMGLVYNPELMDEKDLNHWSVLCNPKYYKQVTMKDAVRDSTFVGLCIMNEKEYLSRDFIESPDYREKLAEMQNDTSQETVDRITPVMSDMRKNCYSLETDSAKADLVSKKVVASMQWSGDAVYTMDVAEEEGLELSYSVPEEGTNLWFDGWVLVKEGIGNDAGKQHAAEAFINFISRPDNVIRNMYYIGYTPAIAGGENQWIFDYVKDCYGAGEEEEDTVEYDLSYFFGTGSVLSVPTEQTHRQLFTQYPTEEVLNRTAVMRFFDNESNKRVSQMWIDIRCFRFPF